MRGFHSNFHIIFAYLKVTTDEILQLPVGSTVRLFVCLTQLVVGGFAVFGTGLHSLECFFLSLFYFIRFIP